MSSFEKEKNTQEPSSEVDYDSRVYEVPDEESTIFSAPEEHRRKQTRSGTKTKVKKIILSSLAVLYSLNFKQTYG